VAIYVHVYVDIIDWLNEHFLLFPFFLSVFDRFFFLARWTRIGREELGRNGPAFNGNVNTQRVTQDQMSHLEWFWRRSHGTETDVVTQTNLPTATNNNRKKI
jgi:hypothetical protein